MLYAVSGSDRATSDSAIGPSGSPIRVFAANMLIVGTTVAPGTLVLRNGTSASADIWITETAQVGSGAASKTVFFGDQGILFSSGCFYDHSTSFTTVTFQYRVETA